jgi:hypothetical protein
MKLIINTIVTVSLALAYGIAAAHTQNPPQYGGMVQEVGEVQYEIVAKPDVITVYVDDHGKKVSTRDAKGKLTILRGKEKQEVDLQPAGDNKLEAKGSFSAEKGVRIVAVISLPGKPAKSIRWALK